MVADQVAVPDLVRRAIAGDPSCRDALCSLYGPRIAGFVRRFGADVVGPVSDDVDLAQVALAEAMSRLAAFDPRSETSFYAWLLAFARNAVRDRRKANLREKRDMRRDDSQASASDLVASSPSIGSAAALRSESDRVRSAMARLRSEDRTVLEMHYFDGSTIRSIAAELGVSNTVAFRRLERALDELRRLVARRP